MLVPHCSVKSYEAKLAALNALNSALEQENEQLREDLEIAHEPKAESGGQHSSWCQSHVQLLFPCLCCYWAPTHCDWSECGVLALLLRWATEHAVVHVPAEQEALELKEEFARRLGEQQRTIDILKVTVHPHNCHVLCPWASSACSLSCSCVVQLCSAVG